MKKKRNMKSKQNCDNCVNYEQPCRDGRVFLGKENERCEGFRAIEK
jgi:hypothetical protein